MNNNAFHVLCSLAFAAVLLGCATTEKKDAYDIKPDRSKYDAIPTAVEWQNANDAALKEAVKPETLARFVASDAAADELLAEVKEAYAGDPVKLTQIAAVTQLVMTPGCPRAPACRRLWVAALERALAKAPDEYRKAFYRDQLRWCR